MTLENFSLDMSLLAIPLMAMIAILVDLFWRRWLPVLTQKTRSTLDDHMVILLRQPVVCSLALIGFGYALANSGLEDPNYFLLRASLLTITTIIWAVAGMRMSRVALDYLTEHQGRWRLIQPRTLPIFDIGARIILFGSATYFVMLAWKIDVTGWLASAGIAGLAVAYAAQDTLANLFAGFTILTDAPYKLNDYLVLDNGMEGRVTHIGFRSTRILTLDHVEVIIPNATMASSMITNMSGGPDPCARLEVPVGVGYGSDIALVRRLLLDISTQLEGVIEDPNSQFHSEVFFLNMGASSLDFTLRLWLVDPSDHARVRDAANTLIYEALNAHNIEIPYPKQDLYLHRPS